MRYLKTVTVLLLLVLVPVFGEMPVDQLGIKSVGVSYTFEMNGMTMNDSAQSVATMMHLGGLHYAPVPYVMFVLKLGGANAITQGSGLLTRGDYGFAVRGGVSLYTPEFAKILKLTGGSYLSTFESSHDDGYMTSRNVRSHLGLIIEALAIMDLELGAKHNYYFGKSNLPQMNGQEVGNDDQIMGYAQFTLHNPAVGAFLTLNGEFTPAFDTDGEGIYNGVLSLSIGTVLRHQKRSKFSRE